MKKILIALSIMAGIASTAMAGDKYAHDASVLPASARTELVNNFKAGVSVVKIEKDFGRVSEYEVVLTDGTEIEYDHNGNWKSVEVRKTGSVPASYVPAGVKSFIKDNQPDSRIIGIEKDRNGYDVELSNGVDLKFDKNGRFLRYDD